MSRELALDPSVNVFSPARINVPSSQNRHDLNMNRLWISSVVAVAAASGLDAASSWGKLEDNGLLASSDGTFGMRGVVIKGALTAAGIVTQVLLRRNKHLLKRFAIVNLAEAGLFTGAAGYNFGITSSR
jgi:hypothetical protein